MKMEADGHEPRSHQELEEAEGYPPRVFRGSAVLPTPSFCRTLASGTAREYIPVVPSYPAPGNLLGCPMKLVWSHR